MSTTTWYPTPYNIKCLLLTSDLVSCRDLIINGDATFVTTLALLVEKLQFQSSNTSTTSTTFQGTIQINGGTFSTPVLRCDTIIPYLLTIVTLSSPIRVINTVTVPVSMSVVNKTLTTGGELETLLQPNLAVNSAVTFAIGRNTSSTGGQLIYQNNSTPYVRLATNGSSNGILVYDDRTNITPQLQINGAIMSPYQTTALTAITTANPTNAITWTGNSIYTEINITFYKLVKATSRSTVFFQVGETSAFTGTTYSGISWGNYSYNLDPVAWVFALNTLGYPIFSDIMEVGKTISGCITLYKLGNVTGGGQIWSVNLQTYSPDAGTALKGYQTSGAGKIQLPNASGNLSAVRFNCFEGNFSSGSFSVTYA
jgi:hypothetical protein